MPSKKPLSVLVFALFALGACQGARERATPPETVQVAGDEIVFAVDESKGMPLVSFVKDAQSITGQTFLIDTTKMTRPDVAIRFVGSAKMKRAEFMKFFQTMLHLHGLSCVARKRGDTTYFEIVEQT